MIELRNNRILAIDGGTGTGKSRLGSELAQLLRTKGVPALFISTGYLYRAVAWVMLESAQAQAARRRVKIVDRLEWAIREVRESSENDMMAAIAHHQIDMHGGQVWIDETLVEVDTQLKSPGVGRVVPHAASFPLVRAVVDAATRRQVNEFDGFVLVEGRDIGYHVLPEAPLRLLLTVSPEIAAKRSIEHTVEQIIARDRRDQAHQYGALKTDKDAHLYTAVLPTDGHTPESVRDLVYRQMRSVFAELPA
ncbi:(d)CMP kinase [bacterium]|nr:MAG: (d)CMP kinase [bacterium]